MVILGRNAAEELLPLYEYIAEPEETPVHDADFHDPVALILKPIIKFPSE